MSELPTLGARSPLIELGVPGLPTASAWACGSTQSTWLPTWGPCSPWPPLGAPEMPPTGIAGLVVRAFLAGGPIKFSPDSRGWPSFGIDASELSGRGGGGVWARLGRDLAGAKGTGVGSASTSSGKWSSDDFTPSIDAREEGATAVAWAPLLFPTLGQWRTYMI